MNNTRIDDFVYVCVCVVVVGGSRGLFDSRGQNYKIPLERKGKNVPIVVRFAGYASL